MYPDQIRDRYNALHVQTGVDWTPADPSQQEALLQQLPSDVTFWPMSALNASDFPFSATFAEQNGKRRQLLSDGLDEHGAEGVIAFVNGFRFVVRIRGIKSRLDLRWSTPLVGIIYNPEGAVVADNIDSHERERTLTIEGDVIIVGRRV